MCGGVFLAFESKASIAAEGGGRVFPGVDFFLFFSYLLRVFLCSAILYVCWSTALDESFPVEDVDIPFGFAIACELRAL